MLSAMSFEEEVAGGKRFEFGKNWQNFLKRLTVPQIKLAQRSLVRHLGVERLNGRTFLDVGSGSGLLSLAARRLGATVRSFDFDPQSVSCTAELRRRYFPDDPQWVVERGSVLDREFLATLGTFDIVYSWGVLHHTGSMWNALDNVKPLVAAGGNLIVAIYNDQGPATDRWAAIKQRYNSLPRPLAALYAGSIIARSEGREVARHLRQGTLREWVDHWRNYAEHSTRGMSRLHDWIDWIGGWPYERATVEQIADVYARDGFALVQLVDRSTEYGCNEFVFRRAAGAGVFVSSRLPGGNSMARRFGTRVTPPFLSDGDAWSGTVEEVPATPIGARLFLIADDQLMGQAEIRDGRVILPPIEASAEGFDRRTLHLLAAERLPLEPPFPHVRQLQWSKTVAEFAALADCQEEPRRSSAYLFENDRQLSLPHASHDAIAEFGGGRFSHWGTTVYFSTPEGDDPNTNGRDYSLLLAARALPLERSLALRHGRAIEGPFRSTEQGWTAALPALAEGCGLLLLRDDILVGPVLRDTAGDVIVASEAVSSRSLDSARFSVVAARVEDFPSPIEHERGMMWKVSLPQFKSVADRPGVSSSPLFLLEDSAQLPFPHAVHDDIARLGGGRFSHWENSLYFSSSDGSDPRDNGRRYRLLLPSDEA